MVEPELEPRFVGDFDAVEQVGPARLVPQRMRIGAIDQVAPDVDRRDRPRAVGPVEARPDLDDQATAQVRRFDRRGKLAGPLSLPRLVVVAGQDRAIQQPADPRVGRRPDPRAQRRSNVGHGHLERRFGRERLLVKRLDSLRASARSAAPRPARRAARGPSPTVTASTRSRRLVDEQGAHLLHQDVLGHELFELVQHAPAPRVEAQRDGALDPLAVGFADLVEQPRVIALSAQKLAQEPEPALAVAVDQGLAPLGEEHAIHTVDEPLPAGVARLDPQTALERPGVVVQQRPGDRTPRAAGPRSTRSS